MSDPKQNRQDFSPRRGCIWAPALLLALAILIAALILIAQYRFPFQTSPPVPQRAAPGAIQPQPKGG
jgi:hypothetical protein